MGTGWLTCIPAVLLPHSLCRSTTANAPANRQMPIASVVRHNSKKIKKTTQQIHMKTFISTIFLLTSLLTFGQNLTITDLWNQYQSGNYDKVIENAKPFLDTDSLKADLNILLGRTYTDKKNYTKAIPYLEYSIKNEPNNSWRKAWASGYLGTCYFMQQDYENSRKATKECIDLNVTKSATNYAYGRLLLFGFDDFYKNWKIVDSKNFRFHFQNMTDSEIEDFISIREKAFRDINKFFNSRLPKKIDFFVWDSREDAKAILKANLGFAKPEFCVVHSYSRQTIGHEMTHVISNYTAEILNKTRLINEGTAVYFDQSNQDRLKQTKDWKAKNNTQISIKDCWINGEKYSEEILYPLACVFTKELIDNFGKNKFLEFFKNQTYDNAKIVFGDKLDRLIEKTENEINN